MNKMRGISLKYKQTIIILVVLILAAVAGFYIYEAKFGFYITAKFFQSGPLYKNMPVYYKGYEIGKTKSIKPSEDYKYVYVKILLYPKGVKLPENIIAKAKKNEVKKGYIDLASPDQPSGKLLKSGGIIDGEAAFDLEAFLADIEASGVIVPLLENFSDTALNISKASAEIKNFFSNSLTVVEENRQNLKQATSGFSQSSQSLTTLTSRFNNSITEDQLKNTTSNVNKSSTNILSATERIKNITANVDCATRSLDRTMCKLDSALTDTGATVANTKAITGGLRKVLSERFAGLRIIFGKPLKNDCCNPQCK